MDAAVEDFLHWTRSLIAGRVNDDFQDVARARPAVDERVRRVYSDAIDESFVLR